MEEIRLTTWDGAKALQIIGFQLYTKLNWLAGFRNRQQLSVVFLVVLRVLQKFTDVGFLYVRNKNRNIRPASGLRI